MKRFLDELFVNHMSSDGFVIAADMGFFPKSRKHKNFIDVGNNESCVGTIVEGLLSDNKHVFIYDVCGYVMKNSYASLFSRNHTTYNNKGTLTIFGWGSGFSYDGCLLGHYPLDDIMIARLLGLNVVTPYNNTDFKNVIYYHKDLYVRLFDTKQYRYKYKPYNDDSDLYLVSYGWMLGLLQKYAINGYWNENKISIIPYVDGIEEKLDLNRTYYYSDQIYDTVMNKFIHSFHPKNMNLFPEVSSLYRDKKSCLKYWFNLEENA